MRWKRAGAFAAVALVAVGVSSLLLRLTDDEPTAAPQVISGVQITNMDIGSLSDFDNYVLSPNGDRAFILQEDSWCIADLPPFGSVADVALLAAGDLPTGTQELRCTDPPSFVDFARPSWDPGGSRILVGGAPQRDGPEPRTTSIYVVAASNLEIEAILEGGFVRQVVWASNREILYYVPDLELEAESAWHLESIDGVILKTINAPRPSQFPPVKVGESTLVYAARPVPTFGDARDFLDPGHLIQLDWNAGTVSELAPLRDLNPLSPDTVDYFPDPGILTGVSSDLRYAVLMAGTFIQTGLGPTAYVYNTRRQTLIPHTAPIYGPESRSFLPYLVGDGWIVYSPIPVNIDTETDFHLTIYLAPLDDPEAAIEIFREGILLKAQNNHLMIDGPQGLVILELGF